ncbi:unnamed protein product [Closterium sp. NIES-54]
MWLVDLQLYLLSNSKDSVSLFDLASGTATAPPATADSATCSQWLTRDAAARLAIRNHLPLAECAHFGQHRRAEALYDAVVARNSSPATAALGRLLLPYLFPEMSALATVEDLASHLRASDARYRTTVPAEFLDWNPPPMFITLYFIAERITSKSKSGVAIFDLDLDVILSAMYALSASAEGDCYRCVPLDPSIAAAALGASKSGTIPGTALAQALHTFTLDSGASRSFFRDSTTLTPLPAPVSVQLDDPSWGTVVARSSSVLPCLAFPSGSLSVLHLPSFSTNLVAPPCLCHLLSHQTLLWHHSLGHPSLPRLRGMHSRLLVSGLPRSLPPLPPSPAPPCLPCVEGRQRAATHSSSFPPTTAPLQTLHMDMWGPARVRVQGRERYFLLVVDDYTRYTTVFPLRSKGEVPDVLIPWICAVSLQLHERFSADLPVLHLHSDRGVMEVARTSMIHAAAPHFLWPFAVRYATHQLNLWPRVSLPETSPTLRWTRKVGDASVFRVCSSRAFVCDTSADKLSVRAIPCVFLSFVPDAPGWQFYHPTSRRVLPSQDVAFDESVPFYRLFPYRSAPLPPPPLFLAPGPPPVDPLPPQGPAPSGVSQVDPPPGAVDSGATRGTASGGVETGGAEPGGIETGGAETGGAEPEGVELGGAESEGAEFGGAEPQGATFSGAIGAGGAGATGARGAGVTAGAGVPGDTAATGPGGARTRGTGAAGTGGVGGAGAGNPTEFGAARAGGSGVGGAGAGGAGVGDTGVGGVGAGGAGAVDPGGTPASPLPAPSPYTEQIGGLTERRALASCLASSVRTGRRVPWDALDIPTPRSYAKAITGPYSSQWQVAMDAEMASWKSTCTYVDEVPPPGANIVDGMWIFRGVDFFQTFSAALKMTTLQVLLHVAAQRDYELHDLDFSTPLLQGSPHEEIWLHRPPGFTGSFPGVTRWSLRRPVYGLRQAPREWHDTLRTTLTVSFHC